MAQSEKPGSAQPARPHTVVPGTIFMDLSNLEKGMEVDSKRISICIGPMIFWLSKHLLNSFHMFEESSKL